ncbi:MAG: tRNA lysidine(34) synthetase TilS, partial [Bifidobacteriaceae bacterium]|nr:tRNA lysidine(34) synthetase TilS [Bifidobacteriaceae bacterium]
MASGRAAVRPLLAAVGRAHISGAAAGRAHISGAAGDPGSPPLVLVACSGGTDSLALASVTAFEAARAGVRAGAVVVDHGLQAGSDQVARRAAAQCAALGLDPVLVERVHLPACCPDGVEAAAREARYAALARAAAATGAAAVYLAHTLDDQAETVLLALARGAGATALAGMAPARGLFRRPFLGLTRAQTEAIIQAEGLAAWHDPANQPGGPHPSRRSEVRAQVMPALIETLGPGVPGALARTADRLRQDAEYLDAQAADLLARATAKASPAATATDHPGARNQGGGEAGESPAARPEASQPGAAATATDHPGASGRDAGQERGEGDAGEERTASGKWQMLELDAGHPG